MILPRRNFFRLGLTLASSAVVAPALIGQDPSRGSVHPPAPSGHELDMPLVRDSHASSARPAMDARQRDIQFRDCLQQLLTSALKLRDQLNGVVLSETLPVQVYRETQAMERLVKQLKNLAKS